MEENIMNRISKQCIVFVTGLVAFVSVLGYAGSYEYAEQVVYTMPQEAYEAIVIRLGDEASCKEIAREYMDNKAYYDSLIENEK